MLQSEKGNACNCFNKSEKKSKYKEQDSLTVAFTTLLLYFIPGEHTIPRQRDNPNHV